MKKLFILAAVLLLAACGTSPKNVVAALEEGLAASDDERYRVEARLERVDPPRESYLRTNRDGQATMRLKSA